MMSLEEIEEVTEKDGETDGITFSENDAKAEELAVVDAVEDEVVDVESVGEALIGGFKLVLDEGKGW